MIKTVGVKNLMFHFYNDLLFLKFTAWIVKETKEFEFQDFPGSATTLLNAEFICRQFSFSSFHDPKKKNVKIISSYCSCLLVWGKHKTLFLEIQMGSWGPWSQCQLCNKTDSR